MFLDFSGSVVGSIYIHIYLYKLPLSRKFHWKIFNIHLELSISCRMLSQDFTRSESVLLIGHPKNVVFQFFFYSSDI